MAAEPIHELSAQRITTNLSGPIGQDFVSDPLAAVNGMDFKTARLTVSVDRIIIIIGRT